MDGGCSPMPAQPLESHPGGLALSQSSPTGNRAYVVGFGSNNVSVVDLDPTSATRYHVIQRIGFPSAVPR